MCISNRQRKNIKLLYDLWYNKCVRARAHTHLLVAHYVTCGEHIFSTVCMTLECSSSCMGSPFNSKSIVTATPSAGTRRAKREKGDCISELPVQMGHVTGGGAVWMPSNEDRALCDFQLQRMRMNRNVDSYRCECSFANLSFDNVETWRKKCSDFFSFSLMWLTSIPAFEATERNFFVWWQCATTMEISIPPSRRFSAQRMENVSPSFRTHHLLDKPALLARRAPSNANKWFVGDILWILWVMLSLRPSMWNGRKNFSSSVHRFSDFYRASIV